MNPRNSLYRCLPVIVGLALVSAVLPRPGLAGQEGKGGDRVEPLFIGAQKEAVRIVSQLKPENLAQLQVNESSKSWLSEPGRLAKFQFYVKAMKLVFQDAPLIEEGYPRGASFDDSDPMHPRMLVSRSQNANTSSAQAAALVFHEAGHFVGEVDHLFLSMLGVELVEQEIAKPQVFTERSVLQIPLRDYDINYGTMVRNCKTFAFGLAKEQCFKAGFVKCELVDEPAVLSITALADPVVFTCVASVRGLRN